jgi:hypothetical protein
MVPWLALGRAVTEFRLRCPNLESGDRIPADARKTRAAHERLFMSRITIV